MLLLKPVAPWLLLVFLGQQLSLSSAARKKTRGGQQADKSAGAAGGRGKFSIAESDMQCTWVAADAADAVRLTVRCENQEALVKGGVSELMCQYNGKPDLCPAYQSNPQGFWKLVTRSFRKLKGKVCRDNRALVKVTTCKRAPRDAHFKLDIRTSVASASSGGDTETPPPPPPPPRFTTSSSSSNATGACKSENARRRAEEHCSSSWASLCTFFFSMLQSDEC